jgi:hypothetical protein
MRSIDLNNNLIVILLNNDSFTIKKRFKFILTFKKIKEYVTFGYYIILALRCHM